MGKPSPASGDPLSSESSAKLDALELLLQEAQEIRNRKSGDEKPDDLTKLIRHDKVLMEILMASNPGVTFHEADGVWQVVTEGGARQPLYDAFKEAIEEKRRKLNTALATEKPSGQP